jgi:hypothetical protein
MPSQSTRSGKLPAATKAPGASGGALTTKRSALTAALRRAAKVAPRERDGPGEVRIATRGGEALIEARSARASAQIPLPAHVDGELDLVVGLAQLRSVIAAIAGRETITLTANREAAEIILGSARYSVPTREKQRQQATVAGGRLRTIIRSARGSLADPVAAARSHSSSDPAHPVHHGALLISDEEQTRLIATDSYRLIADRLPGARGKFEINLPARELAEAIASGGERTEVTVAINPQATVAQINCAGETWTVHLITEPFGSWQAIPRASSRRGRHRRGRARVAARGGQRSGQRCGSRVRKSTSSPARRACGSASTLRSARTARRLPTTSPQRSRRAPARRGSGSTPSSSSTP